MLVQSILNQHHIQYQSPVSNTSRVKAMKDFHVNVLCIIMNNVYFAAKANSKME
jgi:hypothetical protein